MKSLLAKVVGAAGVVVGILGSPLGVNLIGAHASAIVTAASFVLHAFGVHFGQQSQTP